MHTTLYNVQKEKQRTSIKADDPRIAKKVKISEYKKSCASAKCMLVCKNKSKPGLAMLKEHDVPMEPAEKRATRKWGNNQLRQKIKASKVQAPVVVDPNAPPEVASVIKTDRPKVKSVTRFENKFKKDMRAMMNQHKHDNIVLHRALIYQEKREILLELIRRREVSIAEREGAGNG